jgi:hypothetical protein
LLQRAFIVRPIGVLFLRVVEAVLAGDNVGSRRREEGSLLLPSGAEAILTLMALRLIFVGTSGAGLGR